MKFYERVDIVLKVAIGVSVFFVLLKLRFIINGLQKPINDKIAII